jgi:hypothetical protein
MIKTLPGTESSFNLIKTLCHYLATSCLFGMNFQTISCKTFIKEHYKDLKMTIIIFYCTKTGL